MWISSFLNRYKPDQKALVLVSAISLAGFPPVPTLVQAVQNNDLLVPLEKEVFGKTNPHQPLEKRIQQLERTLHQPPLPKASPQYRLDRLYALHQAQISQQAQQAAIKAYNRGIDEANAGHYEAAINAYQEALRRNPDLLEAYNNLGNLLEHLQRYPEAIQIYERALKQPPKPSAHQALLHRNLGILYEKVGQVEKALVGYRQYLKLSPQPDLTIANIVHQYDRQHREAGQAADYVQEVRYTARGDSLLWDRRLNPIPVYIALEEDQVPFLEALHESLKAWEVASQGRIRFKEVGSPIQARITVRLQEGPLSHPYMDVGHARYDVSGDAEERRKLNLKVDITVNTGERNAPISLTDRLAQVKRLALHEIGHAVGIWGHSPDPGDIMYSRPIAANLSERDIQTLRKLYAGEDHPMGSHANFLEWPSLH
jgi:tetratricopeptide (TPR) repeat protein